MEVQLYYQTLDPPYLRRWVFVKTISYYTVFNILTKLANYANILHLKSEDLVFVL